MIQNIQSVTVINVEQWDFNFFSDCSIMNILLLKSLIILFVYSTLDKLRFIGVVERSEHFTLLAMIYMKSFLKKNQTQTRLKYDWGSFLFLLERRKTKKIENMESWNIGILKTCTKKWISKKTKNGTLLKSFYKYISREYFFSLFFKLFKS